MGDVGSQGSTETRSLSDVGIDTRMTLLPKYIMNLVTHQDK
jgi:hypothetical protein